MTEHRSEYTVRPATAEDAAGIATVHVDSWRAAYAGIVPAQYLATLDPEQRTTEWERHLSRPDRGRTWVATVGDAVVGFVALGPSRDEDAERRTLEIYTMYLEPEMWGQGAARELLRTALAEVAPRDSVTLWVLAENERARHFYRRHGFQPDGTERTQDLGGAPLLEVRYRRG